MEKSAELDKYEILYQAYLSKLAIDTLKSMGYKVRDNGDGICNCYEISWREDNAK